MVDLEVTLGRLRLKNPVLVASGTFGYVREMQGMVRLERLGGVIPKTVTFQARAGNPTPRTVETASGLLNAIGLDNDGIAHFREHHLPYLRTVGTAVIANIAGEDEDQFVAMAEMLARRAGPGGDRAQYLVPERQPRARPGYRRRRGRQARRAGASRLSAAHHRQADPERHQYRADRRGRRRGRRRRGQPDQHSSAAWPSTGAGGGRSWPTTSADSRAPRSSRSRCGSSGRSPGPCPDLPLIGIGGIATADDALEFLVAGASAVQVGTATFYDPTASERVLDDLTRRLDEAGVADVRSIIGTLRSNRG